MLFSLFLIVLICPSTAEIFSSLVLVEQAIEEVKTFDMARYLQSYIGANRTRKILLAPVLQDVQDLRELFNDQRFTVKHPIFAYKFIRLQFRIAESVQRHITADPGLEGFDWSDFERHLQTVTETDLAGAVSGLVRLQQIYQLNVIDMANGNVGGYLSIPLTASECLDLADIVRNTDIDYVNTLQVALEWLNEAKRKLDALTDDISETLRMSRVLMDVYQQAGCECSTEAVDLRASILKLDTNRSITISSSECDAGNMSRCSMLNGELPDRLKRFHALCRQETPPLPSDSMIHLTPKHQLRCRYVHNGDPRLLLQPVKLEELNTIRPYTAILHDVTNQRERELMKEKAPADFRRAVTKQIKGTFASQNRICQYSRLSTKYTDGELKKLRTRLQALTRLDIKGFTQLMVANYGIGGHFNVHVDYTYAETDATYTLADNNRLVTMIMYLTDVEAGGQTCFPDLGLVAIPKKGDALLFHNLHRNGSVILQAIHTSCPVLFGDKWIANQWVWRYHQEFTFPCSLNSDE